MASNLTPVSQSDDATVQLAEQVANYLATSNTETASHMRSLLRTSDSSVVWNNTDNMQLSVPVRKMKRQDNTRISSQFLKDNSINLFHYTEGIRRITIAYSYQKGNGNQASMRYVTYGAVVFRGGKGEKYNKNNHTMTAIHRLQTRPVECQLAFVNIYDFKLQLRKQLFKKGVQSVRKQTKPHFVLGYKNDNSVSVAPVKKAAQSTLTTSPVRHTSSKKVLTTETKNDNFDETIDANALEKSVSSSTGSTPTTDFVTETTKL